jgi:chitosanase
MEIPVQIRLSPRRTVFIAAATVVAVVPALAIVATNGLAADPLISQGKAVTTSSNESGSLTGARAVDGNSATRWASAEGADPQWIRIDLGAAAKISRVLLNWEAAYGKSYKIETSTNGTNWDQIYSTTTGNGGRDDLAVSGNGRYVRVYGTARATQWGYSLWEFQVFGTGGGNPSPTVKPSSPAPTVAPTTPAPSPTSSASDLNEPRKKDIAMQLVSSAENSSLDWRAQFKYIEDIDDGRGYTAGIIGFCSGTGDMLDLVEEYTRRSPNNVLAKYLPALRRVDGTPSHEGLDPNYPADWRRAAADPVFQQTQEAERDRVYFNPAVTRAKQDGLRALGQFAYYDAIVMHGDGGDAASFGTIRRKAMARAKTPAQGGNEVTYLNAFLDERVIAMKMEEAHSDTSRVDTAQRVFLRNNNLDLNTPLAWHVYGDPFRIN